MTLACEDANSKLVVVVTVAHVDAEDHVGNSLSIWELTFGLTHCCLVNLMPLNIAVLTRVRSLVMLVTHSLPNSLTPVSKLD